MKKIFVFSVFLLGVNSIMQAQLRIGLKFGASSNNIITQPIDIQGVNDFSDFKLNLKYANYGVHAGIFTQIKLLGFFIQPEFIFNSNSNDYSVTNSGSNTLSNLKRESFQYLDIPFLMGFKLGPLQLSAGPVGHVFIQSKSELFDISGYQQKIKQLTYGYQGNAALVIGKLYFDVRYEGNLSKFGDHINFFGNQYNFDKSPTRLIGSIGIAF
jgi:hypothetical protein